MDTTTGLLERTARRIVADLDPVAAVVLFGSRARGTAHGESDWDVAVLLDREPAAWIWSAVPTLEHVNVVCKNQNDLRERALHVGSLESAIVRDGQVLAGEWERPSQSGERIVNNNLVGRHLTTAASRVESAVHNAGRVVDGHDNCLQDVIHHAQSAAEFTSKAAMMHLGIDPEHVHDLVRLANQIEREGPDDPRTAKWAEAVRSMNGLSRKRHIAVYAEAEPDPLERYTLERSFEIVSTATEFFAVVLRDITESRDGFARHAVEIADTVEKQSQSMRSDPDWGRIPDNIKDRLGAWNEEVQSIARLARSRTQQTARGVGDPDESRGTSL